MPEQVVKETTNQTESSEEVTQQTSSQEGQPTEEKEEDTKQAYINQLESRIAEQQISLRRTESILERLERERNNQPQPEPPPRDIVKEREAFFTDPHGALEQRERRLLNEMKAMMTPLMEVASSFKMDSEYTRLKTQVKSDPVFGKALRDPEIEQMVDMMLKNSGAEINENSMKAAVAQAVGIRNMGGVRSSNNRPTETNTRVDPPVVPSTAARINRETAPQKQLTEDDRLSMKLARLNPDNPEHVNEYWNLIGAETMVLDVHKKKEN